MAVNCVRANKTEEKRYHDNIAITVVFDSVYGRFYFVAKTTQGELKGSGMLTYGI